MKKYLFIPFCTLMLTGFLNRAVAQEHIGSIGLEAGLPIGAGDLYSFGVGISGKGEWPLKQVDNLSITGSVGYNMLFVKEEFKDLASGFSLSNMNIVPLMAGAKYNFTEKFYGGLELGLAIAFNEGSSVSAAIAPGVGVLLNDKIDLSLRYQGWGGLGQLGLRLAYRLNW